MAACTKKKAGRDAQNALKTQPFTLVVALGAHAPFKRAPVVHTGYEDRAIFSRYFSIFKYDNNVTEGHLDHCAEKMKYLFHFSAYRVALIFCGFYFLRFLRGFFSFFIFPAIHKKKFLAKKDFGKIQVLAKIHSTVDILRTKFAAQK